MAELDQATKAACRFINKYHAELGELAPAKFSPAEQHAILVLAAYIRERNPAA